MVRRWLALHEVFWSSVDALVLGGLLALAALGAYALIVPRVSCWTPANTTRLTLTRVNERIQIHRLRHDGRVPPSLEAALAPGAVPVDSWGRPLVFERPGPDGLPYDLVSRGPDGLPGGGDDVRLSAP